MSDYYDQTPEQRRQLRAQRNRRRQAQVRRRKLLLGLLVLAVLAVVLILVLRGCGKDKEPAQPTPSENVDKPDTPNTPVEPSDREQNQKPDDQQRNGEQEIPWNLTLVNRWNPLPEGWTVDEVELSNGWTVDSRCYDALQQMMDACRAEGLHPVVCSAYRTQAVQQNIFDQMKQSLLDQGYSDADAETEAGRQVAVPGTSEHQLGLAVDIVDLDHQLLDESQEQTAVQQWLMTNSWRYGFILRYPTAKTETTGIIYEPWHYRYVGQPHAAYMQENNVCLEEYLTLLKNYSADVPLSITNWDGEIYQVYYVAADTAADSTYVMVPPDKKYTISGNNSDGFIVTVDTGEIQSGEAAASEASGAADNHAADSAADVSGETAPDAEADAAQ